jgi:hypothetical protein
MAAQFGPEPLHRRYPFHLKLLFVDFELCREDMAENHASKIDEHGHNRESAE